MTDVLLSLVTTAAAVTPLAYLLAHRSVHLQNRWCTRWCKPLD